MLHFILMTLILLHASCLNGVRATYSVQILSKKSRFLLDLVIFQCRLPIGLLFLRVQPQGEGMVSTMVVEKQKLDNKVKDMRERAQVGAVLHSYLLSSSSDAVHT